jgi:hypothetical protein
MESITRLSPSQLQKFNIGKPFLHNPTLHNTAQHLAKLKFSNKKSFNKYHRSFMKGKGCRLCSKDLDDIQVSQNGGDIWGSIKSAFSPVTHAVTSAASTINDAVVKPAVSALGSDQAITTYKNIGKTVIPAMGQAIGESLGAATTAYTGNPILGKMVGTVATKGIKQGTNKAVQKIDGAGLYVGSGLYLGKGVKGCKRGGAVWVGNDNQIHSTPHLSDFHHTGGSLSEAEKNYGLGGARNATSFKDDISSRMAYVRSHRKQSGGSLVPM